MILKNADNRNADLMALQALLSRANPKQRKDIEGEIRRIRAGSTGEGEAAYEMQVRLGETRNYMVIHDLRIEHNGLAAQIDHLVLTRFMEIYVCESKSFANGIKINEHGEFYTFYNRVPVGVASPIEQNRNHITILERLINSGAVDLPVRLGITMKPDYRSRVLIAKHSIISRPKSPVAGVEDIFKADQFVTDLLSNKDTGAFSTLVSASKVVSSETLERLARQIAGLHRPKSWNWAKKFGIEQALATPIESRSSREEATLLAPPEEVLAQEEAAPNNQKKKLICNGCGCSTPYNVARFCWFNKAKFGGNAYCLECQKKVTAA